MVCERMPCEKLSESTVANDVRERERARERVQKAHTQAARNIMIILWHETAHGYIWHAFIVVIILSLYDILWSVSSTIVHYYEST